MCNPNYLIFDCRNCIKIRGFQMLQRLVDLVVLKYPYLVFMLYFSGMRTLTH